jgi:hypothetical protein
MIWAYGFYLLLTIILFIGSIFEEREEKKMEHTLKAILARFSGNAAQAVQYCNGIADHTSNPALRLEYNKLGQRIWKDAREKEMAAHV